MTRKNLLLFLLLPALIKLYKLYRHIGAVESFLLEETNEICWLALKKECGSWSHAAKYIFPEQFYSRKILFTIPELTYRKIVELAALNYLYYCDTYQLVRYRTESCLETISSFRAEMANYEANIYLHNQPDTAPDTSTSLIEGSKVVHQFQSYERNSKARRVCLRFHGHTCAICGLNFEDKFGSAFSGIIEVHHIEPLSLQKGRHEVDPIRDLMPLCPNCHRMIHAKNGDVYTPDELREIIFRQKQNMQK